MIKVSKTAFTIAKISTIVFPIIIGIIAAIATIVLAFTIATTASNFLIFPILALEALGVIVLGVIVLGSAFTAVFFACFFIAHQIYKKAMVEIVFLPKKNGNLIYNQTDAIKRLAQQELKKNHNGNPKALMQKCKNIINTAIQKVQKMSFSDFLNKTENKPNTNEDLIKKRGEFDRSRTNEIFLALNPNTDVTTINSTNENATWISKMNTQACEIATRHNAKVFVPCRQDSDPLILDQATFSGYCLGHVFAWGKDIQDQSYPTLSLCSNKELLYAQKTQPLDNLKAHYSQRKPNKLSGITREEKQMSFSNTALNIFNTLDDNSTYTLGLTGSNMTSGKIFKHATGIRKYGTNGVEYFDPNIGLIRFDNRKDFVAYMSDALMESPLNLNGCSIDSISIFAMPYKNKQIAGGDVWDKQCRPLNTGTCQNTQQNIAKDSSHNTSLAFS